MFLLQIGLKKLDCYYIGSWGLVLWFFLKYWKLVSSINHIIQQTVIQFHNYIHISILVLDCFVNKVNSLKQGIPWYIYQMFRWLMCRAGSWPSEALGTFNFEAPSPQPMWFMYFPETVQNWWTHYIVLV